MNGDDRELPVGLYRRPNSPNIWVRWNGIRRSAFTSDVGKAIQLLDALKRTFPEQVGDSADCAVQYGSGRPCRRAGSRWLVTQATRRRPPFAICHHHYQQYRRAKTSMLVDLQIVRTADQPNPPVADAIMAGYWQLVRRATRITKGR